MSRTTVLATSVGTVVLASSLVTGPTLASAAVPEGLAAEARIGATGTITYISNHNVWIARGDGSGARPVTRDGSYASPYGSPSQSDGGTIVATHLTELVRMDQNGAVLNKLDPGSLPTEVGTRIDGNIADAAIAPDGARIAYTFTKYLTPSGASSGFRSATGYTAADRLTDPAPLGTTYFWSPSWVGSSRTLQSGGYDSQVQLQDLGAQPLHWFDDRDIYYPSTDLGNAELSRDGRLLAAVRGYGADSAVMWYSVSGDARSGPPPGEPTPLCQIAAPDITDPTWAPDSDGLAWQENDGIWVRSGARDCAQQSTLILPGGSEPHWSPAALSAPRPTTGPTPTPTPTSTPAPGPARLRSTKAPRIKGKPSLGRTLRATPGAWSAGGLSFSYRWLRNNKPLPGHRRTHKVVRADRGKRLRVRITATRAGYVTASATSKPIRVRRR